MRGRARLTGWQAGKAKWSWFPTYDAKERPAMNRQPACCTVWEFVGAAIDADQPMSHIEFELRVHAGKCRVPAGRVGSSLLMARFNASNAAASVPAIAPWFADFDVHGPCPQ